MRIVKKILLWILIAFLLMWSIIFWPSGGSVAAWLLSAMILPIDKWQNVLRSRIKKKWIINLILVGALFVVNPVSEGIEDHTEPTVTSATETVEATVTITVELTDKPTTAPTATSKPTEKPTAAPTATPKPTEKPTAAPTAMPKPTEKPTTAPTATSKPTEKPTVAPTATPKPTNTPEPEEEKYDYVLNTNTGKFHEPGCSSVKDIKDKNRSDCTETRETVISWGYEPCGRCKP